VNPKIVEFRKRILLPSLLILAALLALTVIPTTVRAQTIGVVCAAPSGTTSCPSPPVSIAQQVGSKFDLAINTQGSDSFNGFDISVKADPTVLNATAVSLSGSVLPTPQFIAAICINGHSVSGNCRSQDGPGIVTLAVVSQFSTPTPTTGRLFTITYQVLSGTGGTTIGYQTGCPNSSVSGTTDCIQVANAGNNVPETDQTATFTTGDFTMAPASESLTVSRGSSAATTIYFQSVGGFSGKVNLTSTITPIRPHGPTATLDPTSVFICGPCLSIVAPSSTLTATAAKNAMKGTYTITVTGTSGAISHSSTIQLTVTS